MAAPSKVAAIALSALVQTGQYSRPAAALLLTVIAWVLAQLWNRRRPEKSRLPALTHSPSYTPQHSGVEPEPEEAPSRVEADGRFGLADDRFELGAKVSTGAQGAVYECTRLNTGEKFAAKVINSSVFEDTTKKVVLLKREICIMRELHHPKIVNILTAFWDKDACTIVMDLARGGDLYRKLEVEVLAAKNNGSVFSGLGGDEAVSKHIAHQLLEGIGYMHLNHVVHRDLKLENILITTSCPLLGHEGAELHEIKIADFGLSTVLNSIGGKCRSCLVTQMSAVGTPAYVAPEVLVERYDQRVDFWSFGVVLYVLLCGRMPFTIASLNPEKHKACVSKIHVGDSWELASKEVQSFVRGLLNVEPKKRLDFKSCRVHPWLKSEFYPFSSSKPLFSRQVSASTGISEDEIDNPYAINGVIRQISGVTSSTVHCAQLSLTDGSSLCYGSQEGWTSEAPEGWASEAQQEWTSEGQPGREQATEPSEQDAYNTFELEPNEYVFAVMQAPARAGVLLNLGPSLGDALVFYTSASRVLALQGKDARRRHRFVAPAGWQIVGLQFEGNVLTGTHVEHAPPGQEGSVAQLSGRTSSVVEQVTFHLRDGSSHSYGHSRGHEHVPWDLKPYERILVVEQGHKDRGMGASLAFYTSLGSVFKFLGVSGARSIRFAAPAGRQVCALSFQDGMLSAVRTCPLAGDLGSASRHAVLGNLPQVERKRADSITAGEGGDFAAPRPP